MNNLVSIFFSDGDGSDDDYYYDDDDYGVDDDECQKMMTYLVFVVCPSLYNAELWELHCLLLRG